MINYYQKSVALLTDLKKITPLIIWGNILLQLLQTTQMYGAFLIRCSILLLNYVIELELDVPHKDDDIQNIINQGLNLSSVLEKTRGE
jgi:hypothetical protein